MSNDKSNKIISIPPLTLPDTYPSTEAMESWNQNETSYDPQLWELEYHARRNLARTSDEYVQERYKSIVRNMRALTSPDRNVIPINTFLSSWYWYRKEHQTRYELNLRGLPPPINLPESPTENTNAKAPLRPKSPNSCDIIFRYTDREYAEKMLECGEIRIGAASEVEKKKNDKARYDKELSKDSFTSGERAHIIMPDGKKAPIIGDLCTTTTMPDYYFFCMSCDWDADLYQDFDVDSCVIIKDRDAFTARVEAATRRELPEFNFFDLPIEYFDPYERIKNQIFSAGLSKSFDYAYQREFRLIWHSLNAAAFGYKYLHLGSLADIAEIHNLGSKQK